MLCVEGAMMGTQTLSRSAREPGSQEMGPKASSQPRHPLCTAPVPGRPLVTALRAARSWREMPEITVVAKCPLYSARTRERRHCCPTPGPGPQAGLSVAFLSSFHCPLYPLGPPPELQRPCKCPHFFLRCLLERLPSPCFSRPQLWGQLACLSPRSPPPGCRSLRRSPGLSEPRLLHLQWKLSWDDGEDSVS